MELYPHNNYINQEYNIMQREESILLHYGTIVQPLSWVHDLCNDIHKQSDFTVCPSGNYILWVLMLDIFTDWSKTTKFCTHKC